MGWWPTHFQDINKDCETEARLKKSTELHINLCNTKCLDAESNMNSQNYQQLKNREDTCYFFHVVLD